MFARWMLPSLSQRFARYIATLFILLGIVLIVTSLRGVSAQYSPAPMVSIERPTQNMVVNPTFTISGWALDRNVPAGYRPGILSVEAYLGQSCSGTLLGYDDYFSARPDVPRHLGLPLAFTYVGYSFNLTTTARGWVTFSLCGLSSYTGQYVIRETRSVYIPQVLLHIDRPVENATVQPSFTLSGWTFDLGRGVGQGTGVSQVAAYQGVTCGGTLLGQINAFSARPDVPRVFGIDSSYTNVGYSLIITPSTNDFFTFTVCARSSVTDTFQAQQTRTVQISSVRSQVEPANNQKLPRVFTITGYALDRAALNGTGIGSIEVRESATCSGTRLATATYGLARPDIPTLFGLPSEQFINVGYQATVTFPVGTAGDRRLTVCFYAPSGALLHSEARTFQITPPVLIVDRPTDNQSVNRTMRISGWAIHPNAPAGMGPGIDLIRIFAGNFTTPPACENASSALRDLPLTVDRPDVVSFLGLAPQFLRSGFSANLLLPSAGSVQLIICAKSSVTGQFEVVHTLRVNAPAPRAHFDVPGANAVIASPFTFRGWAIYPGMGVGLGTGIEAVALELVDGVHLCSPGTMIVMRYGQPRPDVMAFFGVDESYVNSGWSGTITLPPGQHSMRVCLLTAGQWSASGVGVTVQVVARDVIEPSVTASATATATATVTSSATSTLLPTLMPSVTATGTPTVTAISTTVPMALPTAIPTNIPTLEPTAIPTDVPTLEPTAILTDIPTEAHTATPTATPTETPTGTPTDVPTELPPEAPPAGG